MILYNVQKQTLSATPGSLQLFLRIVKHNCSNVPIQKEGQYSLCMLYDKECLQSPSPRTETYTGGGRVPLRRLSGFAECFLDCLKLFQDFKRCIRLSLQI